MPLGRHTLSIETGRMAKQAEGAVVGRLGDTVVLATACAFLRDERIWSNSTISDGVMGLSIAAGLMTPVTGQRLTRTWRLDTFMPAAIAFYRRVEREGDSWRAAEQLVAK